MSCSSVSPRNEKRRSGLSPLPDQGPFSLEFTYPDQIHAREVDAGLHPGWMGFWECCLEELFMAEIPKGLHSHQQQWKLWVSVRRRLLCERSKNLPLCTFKLTVPSCTQQRSIQILSGKKAPPFSHPWTHHVLNSECILKCQECRLVLH